MTNVSKERRLERARDFRLAVERPEPGTAVLFLAGELDLYNAPEIHDALAVLVGTEATDRGRNSREYVPRVVVDLRSVTFLDSTVLGLLLVASQRQLAHGRELLVLAGPRTPMTAFRVTGFDSILAVMCVDDDAETAP
jgi:anti-sigma B factor antagonist